MREFKIQRFVKKHLLTFRAHKDHIRPDAGHYLSKKVLFLKHQ